MYKVVLLVCISSTSWTYGNLLVRQHPMDELENLQLDDPLPLELNQDAMRDDERVAMIQGALNRRMVINGLRVNNKFRWDLFMLNVYGVSTFVGFCSMVGYVVYITVFNRVSSI